MSALAATPRTAHATSCLAMELSEFAHEVDVAFVGRKIPMGVYADHLETDRRTEEIIENYVAVFRVDRVYKGQVGRIVGVHSTPVLSGGVGYDWGLSAVIAYGIPQALCGWAPAIPTSRLANSKKCSAPDTRPPGQAFSKPLTKDPTHRPNRRATTPPPQTPSNPPTHRPNRQTTTPPPQTPRNLPTRPPNRRATTPPPQVPSNPPTMARLLSMLWSSPCSPPLQ